MGFLRVTIRENDNGIDLLRSVHRLIKGNGCLSVIRMENEYE